MIQLIVTELHLKLNKEDTVRDEYVTTRKFKESNEMGGAEQWGDFARFWLVNFFGWPRTYNSAPFSLPASITCFRGSRIEGLYGDAPGADHP